MLAVQVEPGLFRMELGSPGWSWVFLYMEHGFQGQKYV